MKLLLHVPDLWHEAHADLTITVSPVRAMPLEAGGAWLLRLLDVDIPVGASLATESPVDDTSADGWPMTRLRSEVVDGNGTVIEQRISAVFRILDRYAIVELRAKALEEWEALGDDVRSLVVNAELDWSTAPCALAQLYEFDSDHPVFSVGETPAEPLERAC